MWALRRAASRRRIGAAVGATAQASLQSPVPAAWTETLSKKLADALGMVSDDPDVPNGLIVTRGAEDVAARFAEHAKTVYAARQPEQRSMGVHGRRVWSPGVAGTCVLKLPNAIVKSAFDAWFFAA